MAYKVKNIKIKLKPVPATESLFRVLENKKLLKRLWPTEKILKTKTKTGAVDIFYRSKPSLGPHCLMGIGKRCTEIKFNYHLGNEEILLINPAKIRFKPLVLILALDKREVFNKKATSGKLKKEDLLAVKLKYNDPKVSFFTMLANTVHCEITFPGKGAHPIFFVTEPAKMKAISQEIGNYKCILGKG